MNKTPIITVVALLIVILVAFSGCEFSIGLTAWCMFPRSAGTASTSLRTC